MAMRIVIEIDGDQVTATAAHTTADTATPPPELLRAAEARGAANAGPAPSGPTVGMTVDELAAGALGALAAAAMEAGAAPAVEEEEAEAPQKPQKPPARPRRKGTRASSA